MAHSKYNQKFQVQNVNVWWNAELSHAFIKAVKIMEYSARYDKMNVDYRIAIYKTSPLKL